MGEQIKPTLNSVELMKLIYKMAGERPAQGPWTIDVFELERLLKEAGSEWKPTVIPRHAIALGEP